MDEKIVEKAVYGIVLLVVLFQLYAALIPVAQQSGDSLQQSGVPLGQLFVGSGIVFTIIMAALIILVVRYFMHKGSK
jgi:hypothetical protein